MHIFIQVSSTGHNGGIGGAASFTKAVCDEVCLRRSSADCLFALYDSSQPAGRQYNSQEYAQEHGIQLLDLATLTISQHIAKNGINSPRDLIQFPWDNDNAPKACTATEDDIEEMQQILKDMNKKKG